MIWTAVLLAAMAGTLPEDSAVPVLEAGDQMELASDDGPVWFRIVENDYTVLSVTADRPCLLKAYGADGEILCRAEAGQDLRVSAFSDYWFYVSAEPLAGSRVSVSVDEVPPLRLRADAAVLGSVAPNSMAEAYVFVPTEDRRWSVDLGGASETDLDLEVYGDGMTLLAGGYSLSGLESVSVNAYSGDTLTVLVTRYNKTGTGQFSLQVSGKGEFTALSGSRSGTLGEGRYAERMMVPPSSRWRMLILGGTPSSADADLYLYGRGREPWYASTSYSMEEALLAPRGGSELFCAIKGFDMPDGIRYQLDLVDVPDPRELPVREELSCGTGGGVLALQSDASGFCLIGVEFHKGRDGDLRVFDSPGEPAIVSQTSKGVENVLRWMEAGDTLCVQAYLPDGSGGLCTVSAQMLEPGDLQDGALRSIGGGGWEHEGLEVDSGVICAVELDCQTAEADLDLRVTGPGFDRTAEGYLSLADEAGDEAIALYTQRRMPLGVTVYTYEPGTEARYRLSADIIRRTDLSPADTSSQVWLLAAGISGYEQLADVLNRASMDALEVYRTLLGRAGAAPDQAVLLVDEMATVEGFTSSLEDLASRAGPEDRLLIFFSGHGVQGHPGTGGPEEEDAANESLALYDGDLEDDSLAALLADCAAPVVLMIDACHSGGFVNDFGPEDDILVITAAREDLSVSERILTPFLIDGMLGEADTDSDGTVSALELVGYVGARLARVCPVCDALLEPGAVVCPECSSKLVGDNAVPRPEQGLFLRDDVPVCNSGEAIR